MTVPFNGSISRTQRVSLCVYSGFCTGVERAVRLAEGYLRERLGQELYVTGDIVHNAGVMRRLTSIGLKRIEGDAPPVGKTVLVQAHGISPSVEEVLVKNHNRIINGTCPILKANFDRFRLAEEQGFRSFLFGDRAHPEVEAIQGLLRDVVVFRDLEELSGLRNRVLTTDKIALIAQSTKPVDEYRRSAKMLVEQLKPQQLFQMHFSICAATILREEEIKEKAPLFSTVFIVGGKHSANTKKLVLLAREQCPRVHWVEDVEEARGYLALIQKSDTILIGGGASTPLQDIKAIEALFL